MKTISIMTPCFNEESNVEDVYLRVKSVFDSELSSYKREHLFIDNASTDKTVQILKKIAEQDKNVKVIVNSRNFGPHHSPYHALLQTTGDAVVPLVADLQDDPQLIVKLVEKWEQGFKMVLGIRQASEEFFIMKNLRKFYYRFIKRISTVDMVRNFTGFGLYDCKIMEILRDIDDPNPYFRGLISEIGFEKAYLQYAQNIRKKGKSKNGLMALFDYAMLAITTYSVLPFRTAVLLGVNLTILTMFVTIFSILNQILSLGLSNFVGVSTSIILLFISVQIFFIGLVGEYLDKMMAYLKKRPLVVEKERINF